MAPAVSHVVGMDAPGDLDRADVRRVLAGDVDAFEGIVQRWQRPLVNLAYRFCRHEGRAEEMAQEAFLRAFRFLHQWREEKSSLTFWSRMWRRPRARFVFQTGRSKRGFTVDGSC